MHFRKAALSRLDQGDAVLGVGGCLLQALDLRLHLFADGQAGCIVRRTVDAEAGGQFFQRFCHLGVIDAQLTVGVHRHCVCSNDHTHENTSMFSQSEKILFLRVMLLRGCLRGRWL